MSCGIDDRRCQRPQDVRSVHVNGEFADAAVVSMGPAGADSGLPESGCNRAGLRCRRLQAKFKSHRDVLWQEDPDRLLKYRPEHLHYYGWMPLFVMRNLKAMVLSNVYLHVQGLAMLGWVGALHATGLSVPKKDLASFMRLFGTPYAGAIFNMAMLSTFIVGLFVTLVVNRWSTIKQAYAKLVGATLDLCMLVACVVHDPKNVDEPRTLVARTELTRLLNLGHILAISRADALERDFKPSYLVCHYGRAIARSLHHAERSSVEPTPGANTQNLEFWFKKPRDITYADLEREGLVNKDEWDTLEDVERQGLPKFQVVYYWAQALLHRLKAEGWIIGEAQMLPSMLNKLNSVAESASQMLMSISSQMPYSYVHLVSFLVHVYLFVAATWYGAFLHVGFPVAETFTTSDPTGVTDGVRVSKPNGAVTYNYWTIAWCYFFVALCNIMFQGLLDMHSMLENPFGMHCTKFPVRVQASTLMNGTLTMLTLSETIPTSVQDVFSMRLPRGRVNGEQESYAPAVPELRSTQGTCDYVGFLCPQSRRGVVPTNDGNGNWEPLGGQGQENGRISAARMDAQNEREN